MIITIDGPSGTGKSTVAKQLALKLGFTYFDTGAMYRAFACHVLKENKDPQDEKQIESLIASFDFQIKSSGEQRLYFVNGEEVTEKIRSQKISMIASQIAVYPALREAMVKIQREFAGSVDAVFEGRDMGTVVFPNADLKVFLTAKAEIRAARRYQELMEKFPDLSMSFEEILEEVKKRDEIDSTRKTSPLKKAKEALLIDTSKLRVDQVIAKIARKVPRKRYPKMKLSYRIVYWSTRLFFKIFFRLKIYGLEHFRPGSGVIASNHLSFYDPPVLSISCPEEVHFLAKGSLFDVPFFGPFIRVLNSHPVRKDASDATVLREMIALLEQKKKLILFPEGRRSATGEIMPFERGLAFLVQKAHCPIFPAYIEGTFQAWPKTRKFPKFWGKISVVFGSPIAYFEAPDRKKGQAVLTEKAKRKTMIGKLFKP